MGRREPSTPRAGAGERGTVAQRALVTLVVLALIVAVGFLAADVNHRRYRLTAVDGQIVVERGRNMPVGSTSSWPGKGEPFLPRIRLQSFTCSATAQPEYPGL